MPFLPMTKTEMKKLGWKQCDFIIVTGDAYVDHPSFGAAIIARTLEHAGFKVGIIAQPDWKSDHDWLELGAPRLGFGITAGNLDSMVNHYTAQKKLRHNDAYSPDDKSGLRPDRATIIYCNKVRQLFKHTPVIIGGVEASMRRIAHYDFWQDKVRNPILADAKADILVYGMGEKPMLEIASRLKQGTAVSEIRDVRGTVVFDSPENAAVVLPDSESCSDKQTFYEMSRLFHTSFQEKTVFQKVAGRYIRHNPPAEPMSENELDAVYALPYMRQPHPKYGNSVIPAWIQIKDSITSHRGCLGGCNFCTIGYHQGKAIQSRSQRSILSELEILTKQKSFKGTVSDIGGPSANMYGMKCRLGFPESCPRNSCLYPEICSQLDTSQQQIIQMLNKALKIKGINHVFVASGIRFDLALKDVDYIRQIALHHTGGLLKLAPEHTETAVLQAMGKPEISLYLDFCELYQQISQNFGKKNNIVPYIIAGHPGSTMGDAIKLGLWLKKRNIRLEQVQEFTPTPMTISTCLYFTGLDFGTGQPIFVPKGRDVRLQKALVMWYIKENKSLIREALSKARRLDMQDKFND
jgi:uncharacterized radical SAM protein YgiQ